MTWVTWRQYRIQAAIAAIVPAAFAGRRGSHGKMS